MLTFALTMTLVAAASIYMAVSELRTRRLLARSCASMIEQMRYVNYAEVCFIAGVSSQGLSPQEMIQRLGGADGVDRMRVNADIITEVSRYLILIDPECRRLAEQIQKDAGQLRRLAWRLLWQHRLGFEHSRMPSSIHQLCCLYMSATGKHLRLCDRLVDDLLGLSQVMISAQVSIMRRH